MKRTSLTLVLTLVAGVLLAAITAPGAEAQTIERVFDQGTVWQITYVETKPNMLRSYMKNLSQVWRAFLEEQKKSGDLVSYKILQVANVRDGEPDLILLTEFKNMAVFDQSIDEFEAIASKIMGSMEDMQTDNVAREDMRTIRSTVLTRELRFKK
ncbi:MAG: hypothetical protein OES47_10765 [Acidobacteriota bacterium]|nr:hypothetical protein [Acidobacteriota bacterium]